MTCKDCIHFDVCKDRWCYEILPIFVAFRGDTQEKYMEGMEDKCKCFKPKSRFVELPCEVGQMVYRVSFVHKTVTPLKVEGFIRNLASWKVHCTHLIPSWVGNQKEHIYISFSSFGKTVFLSREEAEKALKEREKE